MKQTVRVQAAYVQPVGTVVSGTWGNVLCQPSALPSASRDSVLCVVSGTADGGRDDIIALVEDSKLPTRDDHVEAVSVFPKPTRVPHRLAARLIHPLLTAAAALECTGLQSGSAPKVLIAGSTGAMPALLVQLLRSRGADPIVAGFGATLEPLARLGAETWDVTDETFPDRLAQVAEQGRLDAVLDVIGREDEPMLLQERLGASYASLASSSLCRLVDEGVWCAGPSVAAAAGSTSFGPSAFGLAPFGQAEGDGAEGREGCIWVDCGSARRALTESLALLEEGRIAPPPVTGWMAAGGIGELGTMYKEYLLWPRDCDTGKRQGFPGRDAWAGAEAGL